MFQNKNIDLKAPWQVLTILSAALLFLCLHTVLALSAEFSVNQVLGLLALVSGLVVLLAGYVLTRRSRYEVFPTTKQTVGAVLNGALLVGAFIALVETLMFSTAAAIFLIAAATATSFLVQRSFQAHKINLYRLAGVLLLLGSVHMVAKMFPEAGVWVYTFFTFYGVKELLGRYTRTYLLSPWVNSIWHGGVFVLAGLLASTMLPVGVVYGVSGLYGLPLWSGFLALIIGGMIVSIQFLKRKTIISRGYVQHKMQLWTTALVVVAVLLEPVSANLLVAFTMLIALYSVAEASIFPKG